MYGEDTKPLYFLLFYYLLFYFFILELAFVY